MAMSMYIEADIQKNTGIKVTKKFPITLSLLSII